MSNQTCPACGAIVKPDYEFCSECGTRARTQPSSRGLSQGGPSYTANHSSAYSNARGHVQIIGVVEIAFGILGIIGGGFLGLFALLIPNLEFESTDPSPEGTATMLFLVMIFLAGVLFLVGVAHVIFGIGLVRYKNWGRVGTMVIAALNLINIPVGTAFGIGALYVLTQPAVEELF